MTRLIRRATACFAALALSATAAAGPAHFDFQDPKGVNGVAFVLDSKVEPIVGMIGGVGGKVAYDPAHPESFSGAITVDIGKISFVNPGMTKVLRGADWLNITDSFVATLTFSEVTAVSGGDDKTLTVAGVMSFGGKEVPLTVDIEVSHQPDGAKARGGAPSGDLLVLRSMFQISRLDLGINEGIPTDKIGETLTVMVPIVGYSK